MPIKVFHVIMLSSVVIFLSLFIYYSICRVQSILNQCIISFSIRRWCKWADWDHICWNWTQIYKEKEEKEREQR